MTTRSHISRRSIFHDSDHSRSSSPSMFRPTKPEDWERFRDTIADLYNTMKLKDVMVEMQATHGFKATEKQYKTQLKKWNLDTKYIKASEYIAMIKTKRERERENPPKETRFILRGRVVDPKDITRFEKRAQKKGTPLPKDDEYDQDELDDLRYDTPPPEDTQYAYDEAEPSSQYATSQYDTTQYATSQYDNTQYAASYATSQYDTSQYGDHYSGYTYQ